LGSDVSDVWLSLDVQADEAGYLRIKHDDMRDVLELMAKYLHVDEDWYAKTYPDVSDAVASGDFQSAKDHFLRFGIFEGRSPRDVAQDWKLNANPLGSRGICVCGLPGQPLARGRFGGYPYYDIEYVRQRRRIAGLALIFHMGIGDYLMATPVIHDIRIRNADLPIYAFASTTSDEVSSPHVIHMLRRNPDITATYGYAGRTGSDWRSYDFSDSLPNIPEDFLILRMIYDTDAEVWHRVTALAEAFSLPVTLPVAAPLVPPTEPSDHARALLDTIRSKAANARPSKRNRAAAAASKRIVCCHFDARSSNYEYPHAAVVIQALLKAGYLVLNLTPTDLTDRSLLNIDVRKLTPNDTIEILRTLKKEGFDLSIVSVNSIMWPISGCLDIPNLGIHIFFDASIHQYLYPSLRIVTHHAYPRVSPSQLYLVTSPAHVSERLLPNAVTVSDYDPQFVLRSFFDMKERIVASFE